jgi:hypothetical protein
MDDMYSYIMGIDRSSWCEISLDYGTWGVCTCRAIRHRFHVLFLFFTL